ncbi:hypothetical protein A4R26_19675 [Niastella populi]|uniref:Uncharacterized protein n=1 Tax=Niastella populi TaxID=550983 RepID=A0A1V9FR51_9BACT|nr:hypothetical protein A4R26_19675 [Niastella populi]
MISDPAVPPGLSFYCPGIYGIRHIFAQPEYRAKAKSRKPAIEMYLALRFSFKLLSVAYELHSRLTIHTN